MLPPAPVVPIRQLAAATDQPTLAPPVFGRPVKTTPTGPTHPAGLGVLPTGAALLVYPSQDNKTLHGVYSQGLGPPFLEMDPLPDSSDHQVLNPHVVGDALGRIHAAWAHNNADGSTDIYYARLDPGSLAGKWTVRPAAIPGARTGPGLTAGAYKVVGLACGTQGRAVVLWARNTVGARFAYTDDGLHWSRAVELPSGPGQLSTSAADFNVGVAGGGVVCIGWFDREVLPGAVGGDIKVRMISTLPALGTWTAVQDISHRASNDGQDYSPFFAGGPLPNGALLACAWTGPSTDGFLRTWTPGAGWAPTIVQLWHDSGVGDSRAISMIVDHSGVLRVAWDDDTGRPAGARAVLYSQSADQGAHWTPPFDVFPSFRLPACTRYPELAQAQVPAGGAYLLASGNSNNILADSFVNYLAGATL